MKVVDVDIQENENAGCANGCYPEVEITLSDKSISAGRLCIHGKTCRCGNGCSNTWRIFKNVKGYSVPLTDLFFRNYEELMDFLNS